uniref:Galactokinase ) n=1 Tax=Ganoderma boninense TaxID=34458 RepID=A0A5K1JYV3_9APHY|nr:Galactokinase (EC (Galactose kinase) [Ganoderma boninense]
MKLSFAAIALAAFLTQVSAVPATSGAPQPATVPNCGYPTVPLLRAWSETATDHGIAAYILPADTQAPTAVPLFRLYSAKNRDHYLTANATDRDATLNRGNYVSDGIAGYVYPDQECGTVPLWRLNNHVVLDNFFTTDQAEVYDFVDQLGYHDLGAMAYVNPQ